MVLLNNSIIQILLCFLYICYTKYISQDYNVILDIGFLQINLYIFIIIALIISIVIKFRLKFNINNNQVFYFIYWSIIIICSYILLISYFNAKDNYDYILQTDIFSINLEYSLNYKMKYFYKILDEILSWPQLAVYKVHKSVLEGAIKNNVYFSLIIKNLTIKDIELFCHTQIIILSMVCENQEAIEKIINDSFYYNSIFYSIISFIKNTIILFTPITSLLNILDKVNIINGILTRHPQIYLQAMKTLKKITILCKKSAIIEFLYKILQNKG